MLSAGSFSGYYLPYELRTIAFGPCKYYTTHFRLEVPSPRVSRLVYCPMASGAEVCGARLGCHHRCHTCPCVPEPKCRACGIWIHGVTMACFPHARKLNHQRTLPSFLGQGINPCSALLVARLQCCPMLSQESVCLARTRLADSLARIAAGNI